LVFQHRARLKGTLWAPLPVVFSATENDRFQQKAMGISALLERLVMLNFTSYRNLETG
jgi:hypothetical protein|tara:strand:- start:1356 stop:1529 length:174 start_codon:yes stop_codon:yes gene_type:complete